MKRWIPFILVAAAAAMFLSSLRPRPDKDFAYSQFAELPLVFNGRLKPMDSLARNSLLEIRHKQTVNLEPWKEWYENPRIIPATEWLATAMMNPAAADQWPIFRVDHPELTALMQLPGRDKAQQQDGKHYSWNQMEPGLPALEREWHRISDREEKKESSTGQRTSFENAVMNLHDSLLLYARLENAMQPVDAQDWPRELADFEAMIPAGMGAFNAEQAHEKYDEAVFNKFLGYASRFKHMADLEPPLLVPPQPGGGSPQWARVGDSLLRAMNGRPLNPAVSAYAGMAGAFQSGDAAGFNARLAAYRATLARDEAPALAKARHELLFNRMQPFYSAMVVYVLAGVLAALFWFNLSETLRRSAVWLIVLALIIHTTGLVFRMALEGRPPVTNLYSSAIFIGWGAVVLGLVLEKFHRNGIGLVVASGMGFVTLIIAHHLSFEGDTMEMMRAVLDTNFWLATHVVVVTLGYASTFVAGFLALIYILRGVFTSTLDASTRRSLARMVYGIVCFATLFSFVGTVLGGIWADQSWGRFWGWDPKENGALIIVLWNALIPHLRWGGLIRERGLINCAIVGNIVTSWSWFGVNMLGIGLHSYGFTQAAFLGLMVFVGSQLVLLVLGGLPLSFWRSFQADDSKAKPATGKASSPAAAA